MHGQLQLLTVVENRGLKNISGWEITGKVSSIIHEVRLRHQVELQVVVAANMTITALWDNA
jgi:hypothetical protein